MTNPQLLFLHGAGGSDKNRTKYLQDRLSTLGIAPYAFNFSGHGISGIENSSLHIRYKEAEEAIKHFALQEPLNLCGSSMGGYIAIKLLESYKVENLILFCPAVYDRKAFSVPFDQRFTNIIQKPDSWKHTDDFKILAKFTGNLLVIIGKEDEVIPKEVITLLESSAKNANHKEEVVIPGATHAIQRFIAQNEQWQEQVVDKIISLFEK